MMAVTHLLFSVAGTSLILGTADPSLLVTAAIASQVPDCDTTESSLGKALYPISSLIERYFPHRTITHSFLGTVVVGAIALPLLWWNPLSYQALLLGFTLGWLGDVFTKSGTAAFYPSNARLVIPGNINLRLKTGSPPELFVLGLCVAALVLGIHLNTTGGMMTNFSQAMGQVEGAADFYMKNRDAHLVMATVSGHHQLTGKPISGQFEIVDMEGSELILSNSQGLLKTGEQLKVERINTSLGQRVVVETQTVNLTEETVEEKLTLDSPRTYVSGQLELEDAQDLSLPNNPEYYPAIKASTGMGVQIVTLHAASPNEVVEKLGDYDATGSLLVRSVRVQ
jgi:inner membrane protein